MKKIYTLIAATAIVFSANAQQVQIKGTAQTTGTEHRSTAGMHITPMHSSTRAAGDTLMYMPLPGTTINATDAPTFDIVTEDIDGLTTHNAGYATSFGVYYSTDSSIYGQTCPTCSTPHGANYYHPWETPAPLGTDTAFFWSATSWFDPAGQADNWLEIGPLTIPATGATLQWYDRTNRYRDGYSVLVSDVFSTPMTFTDFDAATNIFTVTDAAAPSPTYAVDTTWELISVAIPASFNGMQVAIAFHHNANDMDVLRLDEILLTEGATTGIAEFTNGVKLSQNMPNPFNSTSTINYELQKNAAVVLSVYDVTGKLMVKQNIGEQTSGSHNVRFSTDNLSAGVYYYSLTVNNATTAAMKMVVIK